jgi:hypothetical protein
MATATISPHQSVQYRINTVVQHTVVVCSEQKKATRFIANSLKSVKVKGAFKNTFLAGWSGGGGGQNEGLGLKRPVVGSTVGSTI